MKRQLSVHFLPDLADPHQMAGHVQVVIDVLRASTTIAYAVAAGVGSIVPCLEVGEARSLSRKSDAGRVLLGGERHGLPIDGFDLGNSPLEYTEERVRDADLFFTTTNGTRAMMRCIGASHVLIGSFANLTAVVERISREKNTHLICAGTNQQITREDVLLAGALCSALAVADSSIEMNDSARLASDVWRSIGGDQTTVERLAKEMEKSLGGRNLVALGRDADIEVAARIDVLDDIPELRTRDWRIVSSRSP